MIKEPDPDKGWQPFRDLGYTSGALRKMAALPKQEPVDVSAVLERAPSVVAGDQEQSQCLRCGQTFLAHPVQWGTRRILPTVCPACADVPLPKEAPVRKFSVEVPVEYADTDPAHPDLHPTFKQAALGWRLDGGKGLGFSGPSGHGKTRTLCLALRYADEAGASIAFCPTLKLASLASDQFHDEARRRDAAQQRLRYLFACRVLLLDDLGQEKLTERTAAVLSDLIEERTSRRRLILWSSQYSGAQLTARLGEDRGSAIARRLRRFTESTRLQ